MTWWLDFFFYSSLSLNILLCVVLGIVWWNTKDYGKVHYVARDKPGVVYAVREGEGGNIRYIGITTNLVRRIAEHKRRASFTNPFYQWFGAALHSHPQPVFEVIEVCANRKALAEAERKWIAKYKPTGLLLNSTNGG